MASTLRKRPREVGQWDTHNLVIGLIGMGDMGCAYADVFLAAGYTILAYDLPSRQEYLKERYGGKVDLRPTGVSVVREADFIVYSVEAANIGKVIAAYGPSTKIGAVVVGQSSVKQPEVEAFDAHLPGDVEVVPCHSLHGPSVSCVGQTVVLIQHRASDATFAKTKQLFATLFGYKVTCMTAEEHDVITANTQVVTHVGFEAMGTAWRRMGCYPWEAPAYIGGIDNVKVLTCLRIYASKPHVYSGLALLNPRAKEQVLQYSKSVSQLFKLMITENFEVMRSRLFAARDAVFGGTQGFLLPDDLLKEFALGQSAAKLKRNSHLSILAMVDSWHVLNIRPYQHLVCETPIFRLRLGVAEYLFKNEALLSESVETACYDKSIREDDFEFVGAVREWATIIGHGDADGYALQFEDTRKYFEARLADGMAMSSKLIERLKEAPTPPPPRPALQ